MLLANRAGENGGDVRLPVPIAEDVALLGSHFCVVPKEPELVSNLQQDANGAVIPYMESLWLMLALARCTSVAEAITSMIRIMPGYCSFNLMTCSSSGVCFCATSSAPTLLLAPVPLASLLCKGQRISPR